MSVLDRILRREEVRADPALSLNDYISMLQSFQYMGLQYTLPGAKQEEIGQGLMSTTRAAYKTNGIVFACILVRMLLFSEARFQFQQMVNGRPGSLFGNPSLALLEEPWPGGTTGDLLSRMLLYNDLSGNAYVAYRGDHLQVLRPDWTQIVIGVPGDAGRGAWELDSEVLGYIYTPGGKNYAESESWPLLREEVAHFAPIPDPEAQFRGMSWLSPIAREVMADKAATEHKLQFFEHAATPNMIVTIPTDSVEKFEAWIEVFRAKHEGKENAYKTMFLGAGHDATVVGKDFQQLEFKATQGAGESRIAAAAGVPPVIAGFSEGLQAATYSNYAQARRRFADGTIRPLWRNAAASLQTIVHPPSGSRMWYDDRDIPFLAEDIKDRADATQVLATAIKTLVEAGFEPDAVVDAVNSGDLSRLTHTGMISVQLAPAGSQNGNGSQPAIPATTGGGA